MQNEKNMENIGILNKTMESVVYVYMTLAIVSSREHLALFL